MRSPVALAADSAASLVVVLVLVLGSASTADASALTKAAKKGQLEKVQALIAAEVDVDEQDWRGNSAIYYAALGGHAGVVTALGAAGADVDITNKFGSTPLHVASRQGHVGVIRALGRLGADMDARNRAQNLLSDPRGRQGLSASTPLIKAARAGQLEAVKALIELGAELPAREAVNEAQLKGHDAVAQYITQATQQARTRRPAGPGPGRPAPGQAGPPAPTIYTAGYDRRVAAVIGINRYTHMSDLEGARSDAREMAAKLREAGFDEVFELYDEAATREGILDLVGVRLQHATSEGDLAFVYFAGHGVTENLPSGKKRGYLLPTDGDSANAFTTGISMDAIRDLSNRLPARHVFYAVDACYSGSLQMSRGQGVADSGGNRPRAVQMMTAGTEGQQALERGGRGIFTSYLLEGLRGDADRNGDAVVTATELGYFVATQVERATDGAQTPMYGRLDGSGEIAFAMAPRKTGSNE